MNKKTRRPSAAQLEELRIEGERQHRDQASRKYYWRVATPVFIVAGVVILAVVVLWVNNTAGSIVQEGEGVPDVEPDFSWLAANWIWVALIALAVSAVAVPLVLRWVNRRDDAE